jgi:hypothetical protein
LIVALYRSVSVLIYTVQYADKKPSDHMHDARHGHKNIARDLSSKIPFNKDPCSVA